MASLSDGRYGRRDFLRGCAGGAAVAAMAAASAAAGADADTPAQKPTGRPNFVFILIDDLRFDAIGPSNPIMKTPAIDGLARRAMRFTEMFVTTSICSPSRACCLTGRYGSRTGVTGLTAGRAALKPGEKTFAHYLRQAGYRTGFLGKWHLDKATPSSLGFETAAYFVSNGPHYDRQVITAEGPATAKGFIEDYLAQASVAFVESAAAAGAPFCLHLCTQVPHMTLEMGWNPAPEFLALYDEAQMPVPANWHDDLAGKPPYLLTSRFRRQAEQYGYKTEASIRAHRRRYAAMVSQLDRSLGTLFQALDRMGLWDRTYVLLTGDNGWFMGEHGFTSKVLAYEESIRVPLLVAGPGLAGQTDDHLVLNADLGPTILDLAGLPVPANMHGRSLVPLLRRQSPAWRNSILYEALAPELSSWPLVAVRTRDAKYIQTFDPGDVSRTAFEELYDLKTDPGELRNLAASGAHGDVLSRLRDELADLRSSLPA